MNFFQPPQGTTPNQNNITAANSSLPSGLPSADQINRALAETGERERLKAFLKSKLLECGWYEQLKADCAEELRKRGGPEKIKPNVLAGVMAPKAKGIYCFLLVYFIKLIIVKPPFLMRSRIKSPGK